MESSSPFRIWFSCASLLLTSMLCAPLFAQDARPTNTDLTFHKFVPATPPENNAAASPARQAATKDAINAAATQQIQLLMQEKSSRTPAQQKIDSNVLFTIRMLRGQDAAPGFHSLHTGVELDDNNRIVVDIVANVTPQLLQQLETAGALILNSYPDYRAIRALVPPDQIEAIAASPDVSFIGRKAQSMTAGIKRAPQNYVLRREEIAPGFEERAASVRKQIGEFLQQRAGTNGTAGVINTGQGIVTTEGDATHLAAQSRGIYGVNGSGLKIGVLSDSANATGAVTNAQATGDIPPTCPGPGGPCLTILQDFPGGSDEGTAMMEIIYDMAPGASLFFATAQNGDQGFANNILALRAAGCDIIVDDVFYFDEPVFQDGILAQAVNSVTASGALYFSSAGNEGNLDAGTAGYFEGDFNSTGAPGFAGGTKPGSIHNFGNGLLGDPITSPGGGYVLQWADPFNAPTDDYDLFYVNSAGIVLASSTNLQNGGTGQIAFEEIDPPANGSLGDMLVVFKTAAANPVLFALKTVRGTLTVATAGETWGHSAAVAAFSVAAAPAAVNFGPGFPSGPFPNAFGRASALEPFTSDGPRRIIFNPDGTPITPGNFSSTGGTVRNKPDLTAADGVSTTLPAGSGLNPFFGTSAAAPHAAAIAALVKSALPSLTPDQIRTTLTTTALDLGPIGFDRDSGFGIVMADASLASLNLTGFANPAITSVTANENPGNGNGIIDPGEGASLVIQLGNINGVHNATGITAVLSTSTPGVTVTQPATSAYPDIPINIVGVSNLSPFTFTVASNAPCALNISFTLTLTYSGGPAPTKTLNFTVQTGAFPITGNLGSPAHGVPAGVTFTTGSQTNRLFRTGVASTCASTKLFPGAVAVGPRTFDSFTFTAGQAMCFQSVLTSTNGPNLFTSAYSPGFVPSTISTNFAGDAGASGSPQLFSISTTAANTYTIVVTDSSPAGTASGSSYTIPFPACAITNPATINHPPIALAHDVTVTAATPGGTVAVSIDNGSSDPDPGDTITKTQTPPGPYSIGTTSVLLTVVDSKGATAQATANVTVLNPGPDLLIAKTHAGNFLPGQIGATYTITVTSVGNLATTGTVTVVDTLPTGLTATAMTGTGWTCNVGTLSCTRADSLATGVSYPPITLTVNVAAFPPASVTNTATVSGGGDVNPNNNVATDRATVIVNPDLTIAVSHVGNFTQGQQNAVYTVTATNIGTAPTNALVEFLDNLPTGFSIVSFGPGSGWSCTPFGGLETCERNDPLAPNSSYPPVTIIVRIATNAAASVTNTVNVFGGGELNTANDTASDPTTVMPAPNLTIVGSHTGNFSQSQPGTYTLTASNIGFAPTTGTVTVVDTTPAGFTATAMSGSGWTCTVATATCIRSDALAASASYPAITLTGNVAANAPTSFSNSVTVSGGGEVFLSDDTSVDPTTISQLVDMTISSSHTGLFFPGQIGATYTLVANNIGFSSTTAAVTVQDNLPGMTATAMSGAGWTCNVATVNCTRSDALAANSSYPPITLTVNVQEPVPGQLLTNVVIVSGGGETNTQNDTATDQTEIAVTQDLTIAASHTGNFTAGQIGATYSIVISNGGINPTTNGSSVNVVDTLPAGLTASAISGNGWQCTLTSLSCTRNDILFGGGNTYPAITVTVNVSASASGILTNTAVVSGGGETNTSNDTATDPTTIVGPPDLTITKTHLGNFTQGQQAGATYTITVTNSGTNATVTSSNVTVVDTLPASLTATSMLGTGWTCTLATLTCTRSDVLAPSANYPAITLTVSVANNAPASVTNTATVSGGGEVNTSNDTATDLTTITQLADMTISATIAPPGFFLKGQTGAQFSFNVTNSGGSPTTAPVTVVGALPADLTATAIAGTGWTCTLATLTCTRSDVQPAGAIYPGIVVTMNVSPTAAASVSTTATVSGGGEAIVNNDTVTFSTQISTPAAVSLSVNSLTFPAQGVGTTSAAKQITITNTGGQPFSFLGISATLLSNTTNWAIASGTTCANSVNVTGGGQCVINITFTPTAVGSVGPDTLTLNDTVTPAQQVTLTGTGIDFSAGGPVAPVTVTAGQTANFTITLTPGANGFANAISFSASGLPSASSGSFNPSSLTPGGAATSTTLSIATTARGMLPPSTKPNLRTPPKFILWLLALVSTTFTLLLLAMMVFRPRRQRRFAPAMLIITVLLTATVIAGCGGGGVTAPPPPTGTPAGTYPITVTSQAGTLVHNTTVTLTVQ
jgi:uncharacterized repeat protein (TIGR01451 family)